LLPASAAASRAAEGSSAKRDTQPELLLRKALTRRGVRGYRVDVTSLPGRPDIVFPRARVVIFCDGDFWHGRNLEARVARLSSGHNAPYWVAKISGNVARDRRRDAELQSSGWTVLRFWETDILKQADEIAALIAMTVRQNMVTRRG
jgi:DNA mismatch endonuclease, patch repair protein